MQWENILAVKISHAISVIVGLELPYSAEERFSYTFAIYALLVNLTGIIRQTVTVMAWYFSTGIPVNFAVTVNLGLGVISGMVQFVGVFETLFIARKHILSYRKKIAKLTDELQQTFEENIDYRTTGLTCTFFFIYGVVFVVFTHYPFMALVLYTDVSTFDAFLKYLRLWIFSEIPIQACLKVWRLDCIARYLNRQLKNRYSYGSTCEYPLERVAEKYEEIIDLVKLFGKTMGFTISALIVYLNLVAIIGLKNLLTSKKSTILFSPEHTAFNAVYTMVNHGLIFLLIIYLASIADRTIANLNAFSKISYKLFLTYPAGSMNHGTIERRRDKLLRMSSGTLVVNVTFNLRGIFDIGWPLIMKIFDISVTYILFVMQFTKT